MTGEKVFGETVRALNEAGVPHMVTGSFASNYYGRPRSTKDVDFVIELGDRDIAEVVSRLGAGFEFDPQMSFEGVTATQRFRVIHKGTAFVVEFFMLSDDPHDTERFARRKEIEIEGIKTYLPAPEDVIITKLRWSSHPGRTQDMDDARYVVALQRDMLDWDYLHRWCDLHGTKTLLLQLREETQKGG